MKLLDRIMDWFCVGRRMERVDDSRQIEETRAAIREAEAHRGELDRQISDELRALDDYERRALDLIHRRGQIQNRYRDLDSDNRGGGGVDRSNGGHAAGGAA